MEIRYRLKSGGLVVVALVLVTVVEDLTKHKVGVEVEVDLI